MPLNAFGWTTDEDELLAELVQPHPFLYNVQDPSRKNILAREESWQEIAQAISKPVEECKKRWRGLRDGYMRSKRLGSIHKTKTSVFEKLQFLDLMCTEGAEAETMEIKGEHAGNEQQVITDNQEYYEITLVDGPKQEEKPVQAQLIKILPKPQPTPLPKFNMTVTTDKKMRRAQLGRPKRQGPLPTTNVPPIKILPKPIVMSNGPKLVRYIEDKTSEQRSQAIDKLIEKVLKENTNEVDVFFRSMAASVKKLQPNLIPKVKMEVCNVIAKYEMQNIERSGQL